MALLSFSKFDQNVHSFFEKSLLDGILFQNKSQYRPSLGFSFILWSFLQLQRDRRQFSSQFLSNVDDFGGSLRFFLVLFSFKCQQLLALLLSFLGSELNLKMDFVKPVEVVNLNQGKWNVAKFFVSFMINLIIIAF